MSEPCSSAGGCSSVKEFECFVEPDGCGPMFLAVGEGRLAVGESVASKISGTLVTIDMDREQSDEQKYDTPVQLGMRAGIANYLRRRGGIHAKPRAPASDE